MALCGPGALPEGNREGMGIRGEVNFTLCGLVVVIPVGAAGAVVGKSAGGLATFTSAGESGRLDIAG